MTAADWISDRRALIDAATEGPWKYAGRNWIDTPPIDVDEANWGPERHAGYRIHTVQDSGAWRYADAALIADSRTSLPKALDALEAVLELHVRSDYRGTFCLHCQSLNVGEWPCPTVAAIAEALGVKS